MWQRLIIFVFAFGLYANTINHGFVLDDKMIITENQFTKQGLGGISEHLTHSYWYWLHEKNEGVYRPLSAVSFSIEYAIANLNPMLYHALNALFYGLLCLLLLRFLQRLDFFSNWTNLVLITLFAAHPIHTEVVANIKSRDELYAWLFVIWSLNLFFDACTEKKTWKFAFSSVLYFLALLSKETALFVFPIFIFIGFQQTNAWKIAISKSIFHLGSAMIYLIIYFSITEVLTTNQYHLFDNSLVQDAPAFDLFLTKIGILGAYIKLLLVPYPLQYDYSFNTIPIMGLGNIEIWIFLLFAIGSSIVLYGLKKHDSKHAKAFTLGTLIFALPLVPVSNLFFLIGSTMAERFMFFSSFGFLIMIFTLTEFWVKSSLFRRKIVIYVAVVIALIFSIQTLARNKSWASNETLFSNDIKHLHSSAKAHHQLATIYHEKGKNAKLEAQQRTFFEGSIRLLEEAIEIHAVPEFYMELGELYLATKRYSGAEKAFSKYLDFDANNAYVINNVGVSLAQQSHVDAALPYFETAFNLEPSNAEYALNFGLALAYFNRFTEAKIIFEKGLKFNPYNQALHENLLITEKQIEIR